jgi:aspartate racemase
MAITLGILGGMGPLATVDFISKLIKLTPAQCDQDHIPLLVHSVPQIPDRSACLLQNKESPLYALQQGVEVLQNAGACAIAIPCNTAHYWHPALVENSRIPIFHIAEICANHLINERVHNVALMATDGTLRAGIYAEKLHAAGIKLQLPNASLQQQIMNAIYSVKSGQVDHGAALLEQAFTRLLEQGAERIILGCTEIPLALDRISINNRDLGVDATDLLAAFSVEWFLRQTNRCAA